MPRFFTGCFHRLHVADNVLVIHHFDNVETGRAFLANPDLKEAMQRASVQAEPRIEFFE